MSNSVSLIMIVRNEERSLPQCLTSVADLVNEIIVVDTGSTDRSKAVASHFGARVFDFVWCDDFSAARNEALYHARGDWIFWLDGDEYLDDANRQKMRRLISNLNGQEAAFLMCQESKSQEGPAIFVHQIRLFRKSPGIRWKYRVHEQIRPSLQNEGWDVLSSGISIQHTGYQDRSIHAGKMMRNLRLVRLELDDHPDDPFMLFYLGLSYGKLGPPTAAVEPLSRSLETLPHDSPLRAKAYAALARAYGQLSKPEDALATCLTGRMQNPGDLELLGLNGSLLLARGNQEGAIRCWNHVLWSRPRPAVNSWGLPILNWEEDSPESQQVFGNPTDIDEGVFPCASHNLASLFHHQGRTADAEAQWKDLLEEYPGFHLAWVGLGELYLDQGRWIDLERIVEIMEQKSRMVPEALVLRAQARLALGDFDTAKKLLQSSIALDGNSLKAKVILSHVFLEEGKEPVASEEVLREVLQNDPQNVQSWRNLIILVRGQQRFTEVADLCRQARTHCQNDLDLLLLQAIILEEQGECEEAQDLLLRLIEKLATSGNDRRQIVEAKHYLALAYRDLGRLTEAISQWQGVLEIEDHLGALIGLGEVYLTCGNWQEWQGVVEKLSSRPQWFLEEKILRGRGALARQDFAKARELLGEVLVEYPNAERPLVLFSQALLQEGQDWIAAEQVLGRVLNLNPKNVEALHNLEVLRTRLKRTLTVR